MYFENTPPINRHPTIKPKVFKIISFISKKPNFVTNYNSSRVII
mgnify:CR=1 FL=1